MKQTSGLEFFNLLQNINVRYILKYRRSKEFVNATKKTGSSVYDLQDKLNQTELWALYNIAYDIKDLFYEQNAPGE